MHYFFSMVLQKVMSVFVFVDSVVSYGYLIRWHNHFKQRGFSLSPTARCSIGMKEIRSKDVSNRSTHGNLLLVYTTTDNDRQGQAARKFMHGAADCSACKSAMHKPWFGNIVYGVLLVAKVGKSFFLLANLNSWTPTAFFWEVMLETTPRYGSMGWIFPYWKL